MRVKLQENGKNQWQLKRNPLLKTMGRGRTQDSENLNEGSKDESNHNGESE
jgi:hypothetical protein